KLERILKTQPTDSAVRYFLDRAKEMNLEPSDNPGQNDLVLTALFGSILNLSKNGAPLIRTHREELSRFLLPFAESGSSAASGAFGNLTEGSALLGSAVQSALESNTPWILKTDSIGAVLKIKSNVEVSGKIKNFITQVFKSNPKLLEEMLIRSNGMSDFAFQTLFSPEERFKLYRSIPDPKSLSIDSRAMILGDILREGSQGEQDLAEIFFDSAETGYPFWRDYLFNPAFPPKKRSEVFDTVLSGKLKADRLVYPFGRGTDNVTRDVPQAQQLKEMALAQIRASSQKDKKGTPLTDEKNTTAWTLLLLNSPFLEGEEIPDAVELILKSNFSKDKLSPAKILSKLRYPEDRGVFERYLAQNYPDRKQITGKMTEIETLRDNLSQDWKKALDNYFDKLRTKEYKKSTPAFCQALCDLRKNTSWLEAEIGPSFSVGKGYYAGESTFAISNVISLFEMKSKKLCENHESDTKYEKFRRPEIPSALMALWKKSDSGSKNEQNPSTGSTAHDSSSSSARPEENSYVLSPNLMYGLIFGKQVLQEIE
ncbi:MAG: hypothetical protein ACKOA8_03885, partial [Deltaproteobacteria bacterium]